MKILKNKWLWIILGLIILGILINNRFKKFRQDFIKAQQDANQKLIDSGQTPNPINEPTVTDFLGGGTSGGTGSSFDGQSTEQMTKSQLISYIESKCNVKLPYSAEQSLMTMSLAELKQFANLSCEEMQNVSGVQF